MAVFRSEDRVSPHRLDWRLLQNGPVALYVQPAVLAEDGAWLREHGYEVRILDCAAWRSVEDFHRAVAAELRFPGYYGHNLHALNDCLSDIEIPEEGGLVIEFLRYDNFAAVSRDAAQAALDIIAINARRHLLFGRRLLALVQSDDPHIRFDPVGASPVTWNPREWTNASRGV
jgi:RNAse (barnase) inhibitor barstar